MGAATRIVKGDPPSPSLHAPMGVVQIAFRDATCWIQLLAATRRRPYEGHYSMTASAPSPATDGHRQNDALP